MLRRASSLALSIAALGAIAIALGASGCSNEDGAATDAGADAETAPPPACDAGFLGDPAKEPVLELRALRADGTDVPLVDGDDLALLLPPQGGRVAFVGVRALNVDGCGAQITGALRDLGSRQVRVDGRTVNLRRQPDGWGTSGSGTTTSLVDSAAIGDYSNVPLCPNQWADVDVFDQPFELEVLLKDRGQRSVSKVIRVTPRCSEQGETVGCLCLCKHGYVLGEFCGDDGSTKGGAEGGL